MKLVVATVEKSIEVEVPLETAYDRWTLLEEFPRSRDNVKEVRQLDDTHLRWRSEIAGVENVGVVTFQKLDDSRTRVVLQLEFHPDDIDERIGDRLDFVSSRTSADLERFKEFIEEVSTA